MGINHGDYIAKRNQTQDFNFLLLLFSVFSVSSVVNNFLDLAFPLHHDIIYPVHQYYRVDTTTTQVQAVPERR